MWSKTPVLCLAVLALGPPGCHPGQRRAETALAEARYPDALLELHRLEGTLERRGRRWRARYALERGLAHLAVGDAASATLWLGRAWRWNEADPHLLSASDQSRLVTAWRSMGMMPGERPGPAGSDRTK